MNPQHARRLSDAAYVLLVVACCIADGIDIATRQWHTLLVPTSVLFAVSGLRSLKLALDRVYDARLKRAEIELQIAEAMLGHVRAGHVSVMVEQEPQGGLH